MKRKLNGSIKSNLSIITKRILIVFIVFALFFTISSLVFSLSTTSSPWPMFGHDPQHTGRSPYKGAEIDIFKWKFETGGWVNSSPAIGSDGTIYVGSDDGYFYAINPNGTLKWKFETGDSVNSSPAIGSDGTIYVGSDDGYFYAINPNGTLKWKLGTGGKADSAPTIGSNGTIYVGRGDSLYAINLNGTLKWKLGTGGRVNSPAIGSDGTIYIGSFDGYLYAINLNGTFKGRFKTEGSYSYGIWTICSSPAIGSDGTIYVGRGGDIYAINPNGTLKWKFKTGDWFRSSPAIGSDGTIYIGSFNGYLYAINLNGTLKWKLGTGRPVDSPPAIGSDGTIYVERGDSLYAINPNGTLKGKFETGDSVNSSPAIGSDGTIYVGFSDSLYAIGGTDFSPQISETTYSLKGSLHCPDKAGYPCNSCSSAPGYVNHFKGSNVLTTNEDCYVKLIYNNGDYIGNKNNCEVIIKGEKWLGLEEESGTKLVEEINKGNFDFKRANKFVERTMSFPADNYKYEFANEGKEFQLYLSRNREEAFKAVPWKNITVEIKNKETNKVFKYTFEKGIFPLAYSWSNGVANYGQCVWWAAKRWVEEVDPVNLFPFYPPSTQDVNVIKIDSNYQPKRFDVLTDYDPRQARELGHYGFVEKVEGDKMYISQFNWIKPGEVYNYIIRTWNENATNLFYSYNPSNKYYFKYYYRRMSTVEETGTYALRDIGPAGGYIFYDKGTYSDGWRYLEAAPASTEWTDKEWGSYGIHDGHGTFIGATETGIGTGQSNTTKIVTYLDIQGETDRAAQICDALVYGGYTDWFLPSIDELNLMYINLKVAGVGGFADADYWTSSEYDAGTALEASFKYAVVFDSLKFDAYRVRAVQTF